MLYQSVVKTWWRVLLLCLVTVEANADNNVDRLAQLANASSFPASSYEAVGYRDPSTVARLYLTVPETSHVIINRNRTRATGRDRYFEVPIDFDDQQQVKPTTVEVLQLTHHGSGQPEAEGYQKYELNLITGTTTYFTAKITEKKREEAIDLKTLTMFMPMVVEGGDPLPAVVQIESVAPIACCPLNYAAEISVRFKDDPAEPNRGPRTLNWCGGAREILIKHGIAVDCSNNATASDLTLKYKLYFVSGDPKTATAKLLVDTEQQIRSEDLAFMNDVVKADVGKHLQTAISEYLKLTHNAEKIVAKDWVLSFKQPGRQHTIELNGLSYEIKVLVNHE